jgi:hypothetical protein
VTEHGDNITLCYSNMRINEERRADFQEW